jgi:cell shape-determining protein MreD
VSRAFWTALGIAGAVLAETALGYLVASPGRYLDPFLLVVVYCALVGGETHGLLAARPRGESERPLRGRVLGLSALSKLVVGFAVGAGAGRFLIASTGARALVVLLATVADAVLVQWLASVFSVAASPLSPLGLVSRATLNALVGGLLFALVDQRLRSLDRR